MNNQWNVTKRLNRGKAVAIQTLVLFLLQMHIPDGNRHCIYARLLGKSGSLLRVCAPRFCPIRIADIPNFTFTRDTRRMGHLCDFGGAGNVLRQGQR